MGLLRLCELIRHELAIAVAIELRKGRGIGRPAHRGSGRRPCRHSLGVDVLELRLGDDAVAVLIEGGERQGSARRQVGGLSLQQRCDGRQGDG